jgi:hypothetical protein
MCKSLVDDNLVVQSSGSYQLYRQFETIILSAVILLFGNEVQIPRSKIYYNKKRSCRSVSQYSVWLQTARSGFDPRQRQKIFPLASVSRPALRPTQPPVQSVKGVLSLGANRDCGMMLTTHHIWSRSQEWVGAIPPLPLVPPRRYWDSFTLLFLYFTLLYFTLLYFCLLFYNKKAQNDVLYKISTQ